MTDLVVLIATIVGLALLALWLERVEQRRAEHRRTCGECAR